MRCKSCNREIVWLKTKNGKNMPVNADTIQGKETIYDHRIGHVSHFSDCKDAEAWRKDRE